MQKYLEALKYKHAKDNEELVELKKKVKLINDKSLESHGCDAEDLILGGVLTRKLK